MGNKDYGRLARDMGGCGAGPRDSAVVAIDRLVAAVRGHGRPSRPYANEDIRMKEVTALRCSSPGGDHIGLSPAVRSGPEGTVAGTTIIGYCHGGLVIDGTNRDSIERRGSLIESGSIDVPCGDGHCETALDGVVDGDG